MSDRDHPQMTLHLYFELTKMTEKIDQARLAQSVERGTFNPEVKGSSPLSGEWNYCESYRRMQESNA